MKSNIQILTAVVVLLTAAVSFVNNEYNKPDKAQAGIIYAMDIDQVIDDSAYPSLVASGGSCTRDCSGCWTNECTTSARYECGKIQGSSGVIIPCFRGTF